MHILQHIVFMLTVDFSVMNPVKNYGLLHRNVSCIYKIIENIFVNACYRSKNKTEHCT
jgi:hypothetical protein